MMKIRISGVAQDSIVDGEGIRLAVFVQGCPHHCLGCHNPETHDFNGGRAVDTTEIIAMMDGNPLLDGVTLSGGEPFCQPEECKVIADAAHERGLNVWCYTGYTLGQIIYGRDPSKRSLLKSIDVLVDGRYVEDARTLALPWRGSTNQRLIRFGQRSENNGKEDGARAEGFGGNDEAAARIS
jgi:anaerobic ribonucleoside-triphosphate reductase activating protein